MIERLFLHIVCYPCSFSVTKNILLVYSIYFIYYILYSLQYMKTMYSVVTVVYNILLTVAFSMETMYSVV